MTEDDDTSDAGERPRMTGATGAATGALLATPLALGVGSIGGLVFGVVATWLLKPNDVVERARPPTADELAAACALDATPNDELTAAQARVSDLERDVATRERRVKELEAQIAQRSERGREFVAELERVKAELETAKEQLVVAEREKTEILERLKLTEEELAVTTKQRDFAREDALYNRWQDFLKNAQLEICD
jgi:septal ring factor EnvC (AmiA/AmiB activator)